MAERRMLAKSIIESDAFSDMPVEAQMLYVRLNLAADDDGFVSNPRSIMRGCGASNDSMMLLINKKFILAFEKGDNFVYLIKHWRIHNFIRKDRHTASTFRELLRGVYYDENKAYSLTPGEGKTPALADGDYEDGQPSDNQTATRRARDGVQAVDAGKGRLVENSSVKSIVSVGEDSTGKREYEGENPPPVLSPVEKSVENAPPPILTPEQRAERVDWFVQRVQFFEQMGYQSSDCWYRMAKSEGISETEINLRKIQLEKQKEMQK